MVSAHSYPTFELSNAVLLLAKTSAGERKLGLCPEISFLTLLSVHAGLIQELLHP